MKVDIKKMAGWFDLAKCVTGIASVLASAYWSIISFINPSVFHPLKFVFDKFIRVFYEMIAERILHLDIKTVFPSVLSSGSGTSDQRIILLIGMGIVTYFTMHIVSDAIGIVFNYFMRKTLINRFGGSAYKDYLRQIKERDIKNSEQIRLEEASQSHYKKWKEYYKSDMPYDEWKKKVIKPFNRQ